MQPCRPISFDHTRIVCGRRNRKSFDGTQRGDRQPGVLELMASVKPGCRQVEQARLVLIDKPSALFSGGPILTCDPQPSTCAAPAARVFEQVNDLINRIKHGTGG
jgi:hypothetical protein